MQTDNRLTAEFLLSFLFISIPQLLPIFFPVEADHTERSRGKKEAENDQTQVYFLN